MFDLMNAVRPAALAAVTVLALSTTASAEIFKGETAGIGDPAHTMFVAFANQAGKAGFDIQVNAGQTLTKSMLKGAKGEIDFFSSVPSLVNLMAGQKRMYENIDDAPELSKNLRVILGFKAGAYHPVTLAGSGIEGWEDIEGKTVFTGPPAGSASATSAAGFYAAVVLLALSVVNPEVRNNPQEGWDSFLAGAQSGAILLIAIAAIGILVGSLDSTGLGLKLANVIASIRGECLFSALMVAMVGALILGMGMPTLPIARPGTTFSG